jgi:dipeptidyl aminopeptidase/acylaminoacyl peptidase
MKTTLHSSVSDPCLAGPSTATKGWTPELSLKTSSIRRVTPSPDGKQLLIEKSDAVMDDSSNHFDCRLFIAGAHEPYPVADIGRESFRSAWSPDGKWISFLAHDGDEPQLYILPSCGGEAVRLTSGKEAVQTYLWSPDSSKIIFTKREERPPGSPGNAIVADDEAFPRTALWLIGIEGGMPQQLTDSRYCIRGVGEWANDLPEFDWSPDGKEITFGHSPRPDLDTLYSCSSLTTLLLTSGEFLDWPSLYAHESLPRYSPNGDWIAFLHCDQPKTWGLTGYVAIRSRDGKEVRELAPTRNEGPYVAFCSMIGWWGEAFLFCEPSGTRFSLVALPSDGGAPVTVDDGTTYFSHVTLNGGKLGLVVEAPNKLPEAYISDVAPFAPHPVSRFNSWAQVFPIAPTQKIRWKSVDGVEIEGLLTLPIHYQEGKPLPLLTIVHGGPMAFHVESCIASANVYPIAAFAKAGFAVLQPNLRGSCGYGKAFRYLNYRDWGGLDYLDLMAGVDYLIDQAIADSDRLGVMGWSYGGYMTMWTIAQSHRFRAASAGAGISDLISFAGTNDVPSFLADYFGGELWEKQEFYLERSPLTHVDQVITPCLIQHGVNDRRMPVGQSEEFYHGLKKRGIETQFVTYPQSGHNLEEPKQLLDSMQRNLNWFIDHIETLASNS